MKFLYVFAVAILFLNTVHGSWLSDIFTGLNEAVEEKKVKSTLENLGTNIKKIGEDVVKKLKSKIPDNDWVEITKEFMHKIQLRDLMNETGKIDEVFTKWNEIFKELNNPEMFKNDKEMYKKIEKDLKDLLPKKLYKDWKKKIHNVATKVKETVSKKLKDINVKTLRESVKDWMQPSFMENKENVEEEKKMVQDAIKAANDKLKEEAKKAGKKLTPIIKTIKDKESTDAAEAKLEKWLAKAFTKPHHASHVLKHMPLDEIKQKFENVPFKKFKKLFKNMAKKGKKLLTIKKPVETIVRKLPVFANKEESKKYEGLTPEEKKEYEKVESEWEKKMLLEAVKLSKKLSEKETTTEDENKKSPVVTENKKWELLEKDEDDDLFGDEDEDDQVNFQQTKPKLSESFKEKLADEELEWINLRKRLQSLL